MHGTLFYDGTLFCFSFVNTQNISLQLRKRGGRKGEKRISCLLGPYGPLQWVLALTLSGSTEDPLWYDTHTCLSEGLRAKWPGAVIQLAVAVPPR